MANTPQKRPMSDLEWRFLHAVAALQAQRGLPPTLGEIGAAMGITSKGHLSYLRDALRMRALVACQPNTHRSLTLTPAGRLYLQTHAKAQVTHG